MEEEVGGVFLRCGVKGWTGESGELDEIAIPEDFRGVTGGTATRDSSKGTIGASSPWLGENTRGLIGADLEGEGVASSEELSESAGGMKVNMIPPSTTSPSKSSS
jgi:hypothetical protein